MESGSVFDLKFARVLLFGLVVFFCQHFFLCALGSLPLLAPNFLNSLLLGALFSKNQILYFVCQQPARQIAVERLRSFALALYL